MSQIRSDLSHRKATSTWRKAKPLRVDDIQKIAEGVREEILCHNGQTSGLCYEASVFLARSIRARGVKAQIVCGRFHPNSEYQSYMHYWVEIESLEIIIDVTADQFQRFVKEKIPDVFIGKPSHRYGKLFIATIDKDVLCINRKAVRDILKHRKILTDSPEDMDAIG
jgi:hypothetical protein